MFHLILALEVILSRIKYRIIFRYDTIRLKLASNKLNRTVNEMVKTRINLNNIVSAYIIKYDIINIQNKQKEEGK